MEIITRKEAKELNLKRYYTGKICKHGHDSERLTNNGTCYTCSKIRDAKYRANPKNKSKRSVRMKRHYEENKESYKIKATNWKNNNEEKRKLHDKTYRDNNKEKRNKYTKEYQKNNPEWCRQNCAKRRAEKLKRTPDWADLEKIKEFYLNCPRGYEVDHIIPLKGKFVSGLHVEHNLQYLTKLENRNKRNKFKPFTENNI